MSSPIPNTWRCDPPESLVAGDGPYAEVLASVFGTEVISLSTLRAGPEPNAVGGYPQVFENLARVFLVGPESMSAADALQYHHKVWNWIEKLAPAGDQHEIAFILVLLSDNAKGFEEAFAVGFGLPRFDPATTGLAVWRGSNSLPELLNLLNCIRPLDLLPLRACRAADTRHVALAKLRAAAVHDDSIAIREAAREVLTVFCGHEYLLDVFCRPPSHQNGNRLRGWLNTAVANTVTQEGWKAGREKLADCLVEDQDQIDRAL